MIELQVNGKHIELPARTSLLDYIAGLGVDRRAVAVEHNGRILERSDYEAAVLDQGDVVEIVRMVGGGAPRPRSRRQAAATAVPPAAP